MRTRTAVFAAVLLGACSDAGEPDDPVLSEVTACDPAIEDVLAEWAGAGFSGSVAWTTAGEVDCIAGYGWADEVAGRSNTGDTTFAIGSVSKAVTAAAVLGLVEDGRLALEDRAGEHVAGLTGPAANATVEDLLLHTSGLAGSHGRDHEPLGRDEAVTAIGRLSLVEGAPTYAYSNAGYTLLALVVEGVTGQDHRVNLVDEVLRDAGGDSLGGFWDGEPAAPGPRAVGHLDNGQMGENGSFDGPHYALAGNGDVAMTMPALAEWTTALFTGGLLGSVGTEAVLGGLAVDHGEGRSETPGWVAFDESVYGAPVLATAGGGGNVGHDVVVAWLPEDERAVAIASNRPELTAEDLLAALVPALVAGEALPTPTEPSGAVDPDALADAAGRYGLASGGRFVVEATDDGLAIEPVGADALLALHPLPDAVDAEDAAEHEAAVIAIFEGGTDAARQELEAVEGDIGPIVSVEVVGTVFVGGELRTFLGLTTDDEVTPAWYALDGNGSIAAVELFGDLPRLEVAPAGAGGYRRGSERVVRVLVVEDDAALGPLLHRGLRQQRLAVDLAATVAEAVDAATTITYDVVCLDRGLPDGDGLDLCRRLLVDPLLRRPGRILVLTARDAVADRVAGLDAGADDYLVKPFDLAELVARIRALSRRRDQVGAVLRVGDVEIDTAAHRARRAGVDLRLTAKELAVLTHLAANAGEVRSAEDLLEHCWDAHADELTTSVRVILSRLRRKMGDPSPIETITGAGYRLRPVS